MKVLKLIACGLLSLLAASCATSDVALYKTIGSGDGATQLTIQLVQAHTITVSVAAKAYEGELSAYGAASLWNLGIVDGVSQSSLVTLAQATSNELVGVLTEIQDIENANPQLRTKVVFGVNPIPSDKLLTKERVDISNVIAIINLISDMAPDIGAIFGPWFEAITATQSQITTALAGWNTDLATLATIVVPAPATSP